MAFVGPGEVQDGPQTSETPIEEENGMTPQVELTAKIPQNQGHPATTMRSKIQLSSEERVVFTEEGLPGQNIKLIAAGELDEYMIEALENYIVRQKRRLSRPEQSN